MMALPIANDGIADCQLPIADCRFCDRREAGSTSQGGKRLLKIVNWQTSIGNRNENHESFSLQNLTIGNRQLAIGNWQ